MKTTFLCRLLRDREKRGCRGLRGAITAMNIIWALALVEDESALPGGFLAAQLSSSAGPCSPPGLPG